jgi:hypothetical protein
MRTCGPVRNVWGKEARIAHIVKRVQRLLVPLPAFQFLALFLNPSPALLRERVRVRVQVVR